MYPGESFLVGDPIRHVDAEYDRGSFCERNRFTYEIGIPFRDSELGKFTI